MQPIIENSIVHGIGINKKGTIIISGYKEMDCIVFDVSDNGIGMEKTIIDNIYSVIETGIAYKGYGMSNVIKRINLFFGNDYGIRISSIPNNGTTVSIRLPILSESDMEALLKGKYFL